jgi:hypothetical protein
MNGRKLKATTPVRALLMGYPGSGKTGALVPLLNAGYKIRMLDFDGNPEPLLRFVDDRALDNLDIVSLRDKLRVEAKYVTADGIPEAFNTGLKLMKRWKYTDEGEEIDLGKPSEWGLDTIVVLDSLTTMGQAAFRRTQIATNKTPLNTTQQVWGSAMSDQESFIEILSNPSNPFHLIVLSHLVMIGPKDIGKDDEDLTKDIKHQAAELLPTRLYPSALGIKLPPKIAGHFPTAIRAYQDDKAKNDSMRLLTVQPTAELDLKAPSLDPRLKKPLPIETGLLTIFEALGHTPPGFE